MTDDDIIDEISSRMGKVIDALPRREKQVFEFLCRGKSNRETARELGLSGGFIRVVHHHLYVRLNIQLLAQGYKRRRWFTREAFRRYQLREGTKKTRGSGPVADISTETNGEAAGESPELKGTNEWIAEQFSISNPETVVDQRTLRSDNPNFNLEFPDLKDEGYRLEGVIIFQSMTPPHISVEHMILIKRKKKGALPPQ